MKRLWMVALILVIAYAAFSFQIVETLSDDPMFHFDDNRIFGEISELDKLDIYSVGEIVDTINSDEIGIVERYGRKVQWEGDEYEVFAYVFLEADDSREYYNRFTGQNGMFASSYYSEIGIQRKYYIAYSGNLLYSVSTNGAGDLAGFLDWLNDDFSYELSLLPF